MRRKNITYYYEGFDDDFIESGNQVYALPADYNWIRESWVHDACFKTLYGIGLVCAQVYLKTRLRWRVENRILLNEHGRGGYVLYCNHTQPIGDALAPALAVFPVRAYTIVSPANLGIPYLGKLLPGLGALPVPDTLGGLKKLGSAVARRLGEGAAIIVYPEAHVWPWYTDIRPSPATSFSFAVDNHVPAYCMTTTYQKRPHGRLPRATAYIDGPFWAEKGLAKKTARQDLRDRVFATMTERAHKSSCSYVHYEPKSLVRQQ